MRTGAASAPDAPVGPGDASPVSGDLASAGTAAPQGRHAPGPDPFGRLPGSAVDPDWPGDGPADRSPLSSVRAGIAGTRPGALSIPDHSQDNPEAADLLDHWGHRRVQGIVEGLSLAAAVPGTAGAGAGATAPPADVLADAGRRLAQEIEDGDGVRLLGSRRGITYGRWTGGPADTLSIDFDVSRAGPQVRNDSAFRAMLERAGKSWTRRIADTWPAWERPPGDYKGWLWDDDTLETRVWIEEDGETSARLEIDVKDNELAGTPIGRGGGSSRRAPGRFWEPRFGTIQIDTEYLEEAGEAGLFRTLTHEIGHVLGAWTTGDEPSERIESRIDRAAGTWTGANVVALHGGPAPFQDAADPHTSVGGERSPFATTYDFDHSGVCTSLLAYCSSRNPRPVFVPHAIDFAFLADIGMTVREETTRPETYGLLGWTDHAGFSLSVSRDLRIGLFGGGSGGYRRNWRRDPLDVTDWLAVDVDVFGHPSFGDPRQSFPTAAVHGTVRYAGGLLGAALGHAGLPPVTGNTSLAVNLNTLFGTASFTSLAMHADGAPEVFAEGSLHYPIELSADTIVGSDTGSTLWADFFGPGHGSVAGKLHDPLAGLLAGFGATHDDRPSREEVVAVADYLAGSAYRSGAADPADDGWSGYRCGTDAACEHRRAGPEGWDEWTATTRSEVLASTAGWRWRNDERPVADLDFVRIEGWSVAPADGVRDGRAAGSHTGTLEHVSFTSGFESRASSSTDPDGAFLTAGTSFNGWAGFQGTRSGARPEEVARWSGPMLGYQTRRPAGGTPFVEGLASIDFSFSDNLVDVAFSEVASRDGRREVPDFAFEGLPVAEDGTFASAGTEGTMDGALFGPAQVEVAGAFHHEDAEVAGSFGARRVPVAVSSEERGPAPPPPPVVDLGDALHVGADAAPELDALGAGVGFGGVAVSSGEVRDGESAERVVEYLRQHIDAQGLYGSRTPGLPTLSEPPVVRLAEGTDEELAAHVEHAVQLINTALPAEKRIRLSPDPAPPLSVLGDVPDGQVFVDFAPSADDWDLSKLYPPSLSDGNGNRVVVAEVDTISEYDTAVQRLEYLGTRAGRIWFDREVLETALNTAWVRNRDTDEWERVLLKSRPVESFSVQHYYPDEYVPSITANALLRVLGLLGYVDHTEFPDSVVRDHTYPFVAHLPAIDGEALFAAYGRLAPGTQPEDLSAESLGPWEDTSFHLRGDLELADGEASFGVALRNGLARPWSTGTAPLTDLADNSALFGTASWSGALLGVTPSAETVAGEARLTVELRTLDAALELSDLERWGVEAAPGRAGSGTRWGDGDLEYSVAVRGNAFRRTGGDEGEVSGAFFGAAHEAMGGVLERSDLSAGFGGVR